MYRIVGNKNRESNFELLRILCMVMVVIGHADYLSIGLPKYQDVIAAPILSISRIFIYQLCVVAVNVFVLISSEFCSTLY